MSVCILMLLVAVLVVLVSADPNVNISEITSCQVCGSLGLTTVGTNAWVRM